MSRPWAIAIIAFVLGCLGSTMLWKFWTPRCNEACSESVVLSMLGFVAVFPFLCAGTGAAITAKRYPKRIRWALFTLCVAITATIVSVLSSSTP